MNTATIDDIVFCLGCGTQLSKSTANYKKRSKSNIVINNPPPAEITHDMLTRLASHIASAARTNGLEHIQTHSNSTSRVQSPSVKQRINDINHNYIVHKYLYIKFSDPLYTDICGEIMNVIHVIRGGNNVQYKQYQLEDGTEYKFYNEQNPKYQFIQILDEPYWEKSRLRLTPKLFSNWNLMAVKQRILLLLIICFMIIIDMMYAIGWTLDELTKLTSESESESDTIYCGKDSIYDRRNSDNTIYYENLCLYDERKCDMMKYGVIMMDGVIMSVLLHCLVWVSLLITIFYDRYFLKMYVIKLLFLLDLL